MPSASSSILSYLRVVTATWREETRDDSELLARFAEARDEAAFATLVWRHGPLVWRTCRHILGETSDAEDAFQATFLALVRKAGRFPVESLAGWLHRTARRAALDVQAGAQRRRSLEHHLRAVTQPKMEGNADRAELYGALDEELARLPEKLRIPLLLHYLEGRSQVEVARLLGCPRSVAQYRLARGEAILRQRLERRGLTVGIGSVALLLGSTAGSPAVPARLIGSTARAAVAFRSGTLAGGATEAARMVLGAFPASLRSMIMRKSLWIMLACIGSLGVGLATWQGQAAHSDAVDPAPPQAAAPSRDGRVDLYGDPLPDGALARIGTVRFRSGTSSYQGDAAFLPDGKTLVSVHQGNVVHFWETATGKELRRLEGPSECRKVALSSEGKKLAALGPRQLVVWDLTANPPRRLWREEWETSKRWDGPLAVAFSLDGKTLAVSCLDVRLFDVVTGKVKWKWKETKKWSVGHLAFSPDGKTLAADGALLDAATGAMRHNLRELMDKGPTHSLAFSLDGKALAAAHWDGNNRHTVRLWEVATGTERWQTASEQNAFVAFLPDGRTLLEAGNGRIRFWDSATGKAKMPVEVPHSYLGGGKCLSRDGRLLAGACGLVVRVWEVTTGRQLGPPKGGMQSWVRALAFAPDGKLLLTLAQAGFWWKLDYILWEAESGRPGRELEGKSAQFALQGFPFADYSDGRRIVIHTYDGQEVLGFISLDVRTGRKGSEKRASDASLSCPKDLHSIRYAVSSDGRWQLWGSREIVALVDRSTGKEVNRFPVPERYRARGDNSLMTVSADGRSVVFHYPQDDEESQMVEVWSTKTGRQRMSLKVNIPWYAKPSRALWTTNPSVALSPDGRWLAVASPAKGAGEEPAVRLWEVASGTEGGKIKVAGTSSLAWSPDGHLLAGGDGKGVVWLWDMVAEREIRRFRGHRGEVSVLTFSSDGLRLASGSHDTTALVWDLRSLPRQQPETVPLPSVNDCWAVLRHKEATEAWRAMKRLTQDPDMAVPFLREQLLRPLPMPDAKQVAKLLAELNDEDYQIRNRAQKQLEKMDERIEPALKEALTKKPSLEVRRRIDRVLEALKQRELNPVIRSGQLQASRGVEVLERIGTPSARKVLEELSRLPAWHVQAEEAKAALQRLRKRTPTPAP